MLNLLLSLQEVFNLLILSYSGALLFFSLVDSVGLGGLKLCWSVNIAGGWVLAAFPCVLVLWEFLVFGPVHCGRMGVVTCRMAILFIVVFCFKF